MVATLPSFGVTVLALEIPVLTLQVESFFHLDNAFGGALSMNMRPWSCLNI